MLFKEYFNERFFMIAVYLKINNTINRKSKKKQKASTDFVILRIKRFIFRKQTGVFNL